MELGGWNGFQGGLLENVEGDGDLNTLEFLVVGVGSERGIYMSLYFYYRYIEFFFLAKFFNILEFCCWLSQGTKAKTYKSLL